MHQKSDERTPWRRGVFQKVLRHSVQRSHRKVMSSQAVSITKLSVKGASEFGTVRSLAAQQNMFTVHVDTSQAFVQGELLPGDGHNGKVNIS